MTTGAIPVPEVTVVAPPVLKLIGPVPVEVLKPTGPVPVLKLVPVDELRTMGPVLVEVLKPTGPVLKLVPVDELLTMGPVLVDELNPMGPVLDDELNPTGPVLRADPVRMVVPVAPVSDAVWFPSDMVVLMLPRPMLVVVLSRAVPNGVAVSVTAWTGRAELISPRGASSALDVSPGEKAHPPSPTPRAMSDEMSLNLLLRDMSSDLLRVRPSAPSRPRWTASPSIGRRFVFSEVRARGDGARWFFEPWSDLF
ncbi:MAG TPA: hypothetical protein VM580_13300 [Labilithrix sp.]|nr:hypothetical protein [Labilithrix sp.]